MFSLFNLTVSIVDLTTKQNTVIRDQQTLLEGGFIFILGITSATGMPVELCNDDDFDNGRCQRGYYLFQIFLEAFIYLSF